MRKLSINQKITIGLSLAIVFLGALTLYFSFLRVSYKLLGNVISTNLESDKLSMQVSFSNQGNQNIIITDLNMYGIAYDKTEYWFNLENYSPELPLLINPGEIQILSFLSPFGSGLSGFTRAYYPLAIESDPTLFARFIPGAKCITFDLRFRMVKANGLSVYPKMVDAIEICMDPPPSTSPSVIPNMHPFTIIKR